VNPRPARGGSSSDSELLVSSDESELEEPSLEEPSDEALELSEDSESLEDEESDEPLSSLEDEDEPAVWLSFNVFYCATTSFRGGKSVGAPSFRMTTSLTAFWSALATFA